MPLRYRRGSATLPRIFTISRVKREILRTREMRIGVDAGGTFTDFIVLEDDGRLQTFKLRSNPSAPAEVILEGLNRAAGRARADVVHGSTVATNALLET